MKQRLLLGVTTAGAVLALAGAPVVADDDGQGTTHHIVDIGGWRGTVAAGDINGDAELEIVAGCHAFTTAGTRVNGFPLDMPPTGTTSPAIYDIDGNGASEIIYSCVGDELDESGIYVFDGRGRLWPGFPATGFTNTSSTPAVGDIDGDDVPEIVVGSTGPVKGIYAFSAVDGSLKPGFPVSLNAWVTGTPALGDVDGDGVNDIVAATRYPIGRLYALDGSGQTLPGFPYTLRSGVEGSVLLTDVDRIGVDGGHAIAPAQLEIFVATTSGWVEGVSGTGQSLAGWPRRVKETVNASPVAGDIDADGMPELLVRTTRGSIAAMPLDNSGLIIHRSGLFGQGSLGLVLADVTGDLVPELLGAASEIDASLLAYDGSGLPVPGFPIELEGAEAGASPTVLDLDGDRRIDIIVANHKLELVRLDAAYHYDSQPWPTLGGGFDRLGMYVDPLWRPYPAEIRFIPATLSPFSTNKQIQCAIEFEAVNRLKRVDPTGIFVTKVAGRTLASPISMDPLVTPWLADRDSDGIREAIVIFNQTELRYAMPPGHGLPTPGTITFTVSGSFRNGREWTGRGKIGIVR